MDPISLRVLHPELSIEASSSASPERPIDPSPHAKIPPIASRKRPFVGKRLVRPVVGGLLIAIFVAVAWQTYRDNQTGKLVGAWRHSFGIWLSSGLGASERVFEINSGTKRQIVRSNINARGNVEIGQ